MSTAPTEKDGFTLIGVLVFCMILIPLCAALAQASRDFAYGVGRDLDDTKQEFLAGGIAEAVAAQLSSNRSLFDALNGRWLTCTLRDKSVAVSARDHDGKIDLNNASSELLVAGFEAAGVDGEKARQLQQFVEASRSNGDVPREISTLIAKVSLKHAPFEHVDELQDALSALDGPAADLDRLFTVDSGVANVEEKTAAPELRAKLRGLANERVIVKDNGGFDHVDVVVHLRSRSDRKGGAVSRTFRKISAAGDVVLIRTARLRSSWQYPEALQRADCIGLLGLAGGA